MSTENAIEITQLSKLYKLYKQPADMFLEMVTGKQYFKPFWALSDVSFTVPRGHVVGVMGRNGAGKSTLLKIIAGTLDKTSGTVSVKGRISSILELGTGFNPEYTGRQNVYLGGLMIGMTQEEIKQKMDWIIDFSELGEVIDQPFKTYSTGMQARLTFSTAVCIEPDILIVDEALSVGDAKFARKCFGKIEEFRNAGNTILLVSHDTNTINNFCDHAILLEQGKVFEQGKPYHVSQVYYQLLFASSEDFKDRKHDQDLRETDQDSFTQMETAIDDNKTDHKQDLSSAANDVMISNVAIDQTLKPVDGQSKGDLQLVESFGGTMESDRDLIRQRALKFLRISSNTTQENEHQRRMGNGKAEILDYCIMDNGGKRAVLLEAGKEYTFLMRAVFYEDVEGATFGYVIRSIKGVDLFGTSTLIQKQPTLQVSKGTVVESRCKVTMWLTNGIYFLTIAIADPYADSNVQYDMRYDALQFEVAQKNGIFTTSIVDLDAKNIVTDVIMGEANHVSLPHEIFAKYGIP